MIKAVFFYLYGTLARFYPLREQIQTDACETFGFTVSHAGIVRGYSLADEFMAKVNASPLPVSHLDEAAHTRFFAKYEHLILQGAGIDVNLEVAGRVWAKVRETPYGMALFDDVLPVLEMLRVRGLILGLLSNINWDVRELCEELGLLPYLNFSITSREAGVVKPHPPIFLMALERAGVANTETLHVGDSHLSDVEGARGVGICPVLLDRDGMFGNIHDCLKISDLFGVFEHL